MSCLNSEGSSFKSQLVALDAPTLARAPPMQQQATSGSVRASSSHIGSANASSELVDNITPIGLVQVEAGSASLHYVTSGELNSLNSLNSPDWLHGQIGSSQNRRAEPGNECSCSCKSAPTLCQVADDCTWCSDRKSHSIGGSSGAKGADPCCCTCCCGQTLPDTSAWRSDE